MVGSTNWKIKTSPSSNLCAAENCLQPELNPVLYAMYFNSYCFPHSSSKMTVVSLFGKYALQNAPGSPCYFFFKKKGHKLDMYSFISNIINRIEVFLDFLDKIHGGVLEILTIIFN